MTRHGVRIITSFRRGRVGLGVASTAPEGAQQANSTADTIWLQVRDMGAGHCGRAAWVSRNDRPESDGSLMGAGLVGLVVGSSAGNADLPFDDYGVYPVSCADQVGR